MATTSRTSKTQTKSSMHKKAPPPPSYSAFFTGATTTEPPKDTVFYAIYPDSILQLSPNFISDPEYQDLISTLHSTHLQIHGIISPYTTNYIFQHEPFSLSLLSSPNSNPNCPCSSHSLPHFHGKTKYGEALEDEWFIVFLLFEISCRIPNLTVRVWDSDGEFLLFEGAEFLFGLNPNNTRNRVFIRHGGLNIVPEEILPSNTPFLEFLIGLARNGCIGAPESAVSFFRKRVSEYPGRANSNMHRVRVRVPISVAKVLKHEPSLISLAVEGFCNRDGTDSVNFAEKMERFQSSGSGNEELVLVSVRMSRAMYAKLAQQSFDAPKCYPMLPKTDSSAYVEAMLGMKIACGFEMMYQKRRREGIEVKGNTWEEFKDGLKSNGYFQDLPSKSKKYHRLSKNAHEYYTKISMFSRASEVMNAPVRRIDEILALPQTAEEFKGVNPPPSNDDAWLYNGRDEIKLAMLKRQEQMKHFAQIDKKSKKATKKKSADLSDATMLNKVPGACFPVNRDSNAVVPGIECLRQYMESLRLSCEGTVGDADSEEGSSSDIDFGYGPYGAFGYDYGSDFPYVDFTRCDAVTDDSDSDHDPLEAVIFAHMVNSFMYQFGHSTDNEGTASDSNVEEKSDDASTPAELKTNTDSFASQLGLRGSGSTFLGLIGQQLPKAATKGPL